MMKKILCCLVLLLACAGGVNAQVLMDSVLYPVENSWDSACHCFTDSLRMYVIIDTANVANEELLMEFDFIKVGTDTPFWTLSIMIADTNGVYTFVPAVYQNFQNGDMNLNGIRTIGDIALLIEEVFPGIFDAP